MLYASHISISLYDTNIKECSQTFVLLLLCSQQFSLYFQCNKWDPYYMSPRSLVHVYLHIGTHHMSQYERNIFTKTLHGFCLSLQERIKKKDTAYFHSQYQISLVQNFQNFITSHYIFRHIWTSSGVQYCCLMETAKEWSTASFHQIIKLNTWSPYQSKYIVWYDLEKVWK